MTGNDLYYDISGLSKCGSYFRTVPYCVSAVSFPASALVFAGGLYQVEQQNNKESRDASEAETAKAMVLVFENVALLSDSLKIFTEELEKNEGIQPEQKEAMKNELMGMHLKVLLELNNNTGEGGQNILDGLRVKLTDISATSANRSSELEYKISQSPEFLNNSGSNIGQDRESTLKATFETQRNGLLGNKKDD